MRETKYKQYTPNSPEKIKEAMDELAKSQYEYVDIIPFPTNDFIVLFYREKDKIAPTEEDIATYSYKVGQANEYTSEKESRGIVEYLKEYKIFVIIIAAVIAIYYFFVLKWYT